MHWGLPTTPPASLSISATQDAIRDKATNPHVLNDDSDTNPLYGGQSSEVKTAAGANVPLERSTPSFCKYGDHS